MKPSLLGRMIFSLSVVAAGITIATLFARLDTRDPWVMASAVAQAVLWGVVLRLSPLVKENNP